MISGRRTDPLIARLSFYHQPITTSPTVASILWVNCRQSSPTGGVPIATPAITSGFCDGSARYRGETFACGQPRFPTCGETTAIWWFLERFCFVHSLCEKEKLGAYAMKRVAAGAHLPTSWLFEPAKLPDDRTDDCLDSRPTTSLCGSVQNSIHPFCDSFRT